MVPSSFALDYMEEHMRTPTWYQALVLGEAEATFWIPFHVRVDSDDYVRRMPPRPPGATWYKPIRRSFREETKRLLFLLKFAGGRRRRALQYQHTRPRHGVSVLLHTILLSPCCIP